MLIPKINLAILSVPGFYMDGLIAYFNSTNNCTIKVNCIDPEIFLKEISKIHYEINIGILDEEVPHLHSDFISTLLRQFPAIRFLVIGKKDLSIKIEYKMSGVHAYVSRDVYKDGFMYILKNLRETGTYLDENLSKINSNGRFVFKNLNFTVRDLHFLKYCIEGCTYGEISQRMFLSTRTIEDYRDNLFKKLEVRNKAELIIAALKLGLVELD